MSEQLMSLIACHEGHYQIFEVLPDMNYWGGWPCYIARANGLSEKGPMYFAVPKHNPGVANWYNRERLPFTPPDGMLKLLPKEKAFALAMVWMRGGKEFEAVPRIQRWEGE